MAKITGINIQTKNKKRCNVFLDGEFAFGTTIEAVYKFPLKVGMEINQSEIEAICYEAEKTQALDQAVSYVSGRFKTKKQVKDYLLKKGYDEKIVFFVIDKLKEYDYINDVEYAKRYLESCSKKEGKKLSDYKLMMKGVKKTDIERAYDFAEIDTFQSACEVAKKHMRNKEVSKENVQKTYRYLLGKGFSYEEASKAVEQFKEI